jgi:hypothetical protein
MRWFRRLSAGKQASQDEIPKTLANASEAAATRLGPRVISDAEVTAKLCSIEVQSMPGGPNSSEWASWDRVAAVGALAALIIVRHQKVSETEFGAFERSLDSALAEWDVEAPESLRHCVRFIVETAILKPFSDEEETVFSNACGLWVLTNFRGATPSEEQIATVRAIGAFLFKRASGMTA